MKDSVDIGEQIKTFEPLIFKVIHNQILKHWTKGSGSKTAMISRLGMTLDDLMQIGRMWTFEHIQWYNEHGDKSKASLFTLLHSHLNKKFMSMSLKYHGGNGNSIDDSIRAKVESYVNTFDHSASLKDNKALLQNILPYSQGWPRYIKAESGHCISTNERLFRYAKKILKELSGRRMIFCDIDDHLDCRSDWNPESCLVVKEEIQKRYHIKENPMKRQLKIYYYDDSKDNDMVEIANVTYCCNEMKRHFEDVTNFLFFDDKVIPSLAIEDKKTGASVEIRHCPFCGGEITIKSSRL